MKAVLFLTPLFFILTLLQTSFLVHFSLGGFILPLVFLAVVVMALVELPRSSGRVAGALIGGVFLDALSSHFFGFWTFTLALSSLAITYIMHTYVRFPLLKNS